MPKTPESESQEAGQVGSGTEGEPDATQTEEEEEQQETQEAVSQEAQEAQTQGEEIAVAGRSPEDAEAYIRYLEGLATSQAEELQASRRRVGDAPPPPKEEADFFSDPKAAIKETMEEMITPFRQDLARSQVEVARGAMRREFEDWDTLEPTVNILMKQAGIEPAGETAESVLRSFTYMALGVQARHGKSEEAPMRKESPSRQPPPQHRPSNAPLPRRDEKKKSRALTENEKRMAREQGMSDEEFLYWQGIEASDVMTAEFEGGRNG